MDFHGKDFVALAEESNILMHKDYDAIYNKALLEEMVFLLESMESGELSTLVTEAGTFDKIKRGIMNFIDSIISKFREKSVENKKKYIPWIKEVQDTLKESAKDKTIKIPKYWDNDYVKRATDLTNMINSAYKSKKYDDISFLSTPLRSAIGNMEELNSSNTTIYLKNFFRVGVADDKNHSEKVEGKELSAHVEDMVSYVSSMDGSVIQSIERIRKALDTAQKSFEPTETPTGESMLDLIGLPICESDVTLCRDYSMKYGFSSVLEADDKNPEVKIGKGNAGVNNAAQASSNEQNNGKESTARVQDLTPEGGENTEAKKTSAAATAYKENIDRFFKVAISAYLTAREEQFLDYINAICIIRGSRPKFDNNGTYVPDEKKDTKEANTKAK